ncbi:MAG: 50S ribosomal protein L19e [Candidatus Diapherotrites archaeon]|nr:50S ribosomal protein L19e [Candidatus Diapherotrites archaeon]
MELNKAKEMAAGVLKVGKNKVFISPTDATKIAEAMTKDDIRGLIADRVIKKRQDNSQSKGRARALKAKKIKGRKKGRGKRKGTKKTRGEKKKTWIKKVRAQRRTLRELRETNPEAVADKRYSDVYRKIKGNFFKGKKYLIEYIEGGKK